ncbi:hypothetical protein LDENG_00199070, partial [Lucifuga dentata]
MTLPPDWLFVPVLIRYWLFEPSLTSCNQALFSINFIVTSSFLYRRFFFLFLFLFFSFFCPCLHV